MGAFKRVELMRGTSKAGRPCCAATNFKVLLLRKLCYIISSLGS